jgi:hypothetical protein
MCPAAPTLENAIIKYADARHRIGTRAKYLCDRGYTPDTEDNYITCSTNAAWSSTPFTCSGE